jgi:hypothetical protein
MDIKKIMFLLLMFFVFPVFVHAETRLDPNCTYSERMNLINLVNATQINYQLYTASNGDKLFSVTISGFSSEFYVKDENGVTYTYNNNDAVSVGGYIPGKTYKFPFYAAETGFCKGYKIMTKMLYLPPYNKYSEDPLCIGHENFELCKKYTPVKINSYMDFLQRMYEYLGNQNKQEEEKPPIEEPKVEKGLFETIMDFVSVHYMYFLGGIIGLGTVGIILIEARKRRSIL